MSSRITLSLVLAALAVAGCTKSPEAENAPGPGVTGARIVFPANSPQLAALAVVPVEPQASEVHRANGRVVWDEDATVRVYSPVAGRVQTVAVTLGQAIAKDATLATLNSPDLGQAQAEFHKAEADRLLAEQTLTRVKDLFEHGALARKELETAENALAGAQSERQRAAARLALYNASAGGEVDGLFVLHAPVGGVLVEKNINPGQEVRSDQMLANVPQLSAPLFVVTDPTRLAILVDATEPDLTVLRPGVEFKIRSTSFPERTFSGRVNWISDALDPTTRRVTVRGTIENPERLLKAEMFVTTEFEAPGAAGIGVPVGAVIMKRERYFVFVEEKPGTYVRREIEAGPEQNGKIAVRRGLAVGERVVTDGCVLLEEIHAGNAGT